VIKLIEVCEILNASKGPDRKYTLREIYVNPEHIISLREASSYEQKIVEGIMPEDLDPRQRFTRLMLNRGQTGSEIIVVGAPEMIEDKLRMRGVLHG